MKINARPIHQPASKFQSEVPTCSCSHHEPSVQETVADQFTPSVPTPVDTKSLSNAGHKAAVDLLNGFPLPATSLPALRELAENHHPEQVTHVIYHGGCPDGFGAALGAWKALGDEVEYIGASYNQPPPELPEDARVAIVDFSYPRETLLEFKDKVEDLVVLDHHKSAAKELEGLDFAVFDMKRAGAGLSWHYFHPETPLPPLMAYLEDRDLWNNALPQTKEVTFALRKHPKEFEHWNELNVEDLKKEGEPLVRAVNEEVAKACETAHMVEVGGHKVPAVRHRRYASDIGHSLLKKFPDSDFAAVYSKRKGGWKWELRSRGDVDVSVIAKKYGGGGHKAASGFWQGPDLEIPGTKQD